MREMKENPIRVSKNLSEVMDNEADVTYRLK